MATPADHWDYFVAHAGADIDTAKRLTVLLEAGGGSVFVDAARLLPGDVWIQHLADAQEKAAVTVVLVSKHTGTAYYQLEEVATAIELSRYAGSGHRVVPVYLDSVARIPYGLRIRHGVWALDDTGLECAARELLRLLPRPGDEPTAKLFSPHVPKITRFFAGRDEFLGRLAVQGPTPTSVLTYSIDGLGGVGKTTVVAALCWEQEKVVDIVWWLRADTESTMLADLADLAVKLGQGGSREDDLAAQAERATGALENEPRSWILVFDNADSDTLVFRYAPQRGNGRVIVTTRRRDFDRLGAPLGVDPFDQSTAEAFLRTRVAQKNPAAANEPAAADVARRLGWLPLALEQAGAYVAYSPTRSFGGYLDLLEAAGLDPFVDWKPLDYQATATTTWQVSIDAAGHRAPIAPQVMNAFGYLAAAQIPLTFFVESAGHPYLASTPSQVVAAIDELYTYSLISIERGRLSVHPVVRDAVRRHADPAASLFVVDALHHTHPRDVARPDAWATCAILLPHVVNVAATAVDDEATAFKVGELLDWAGTALAYAGAGARAIPILEQAVDIDARLRGPDDRATLAARNHLAIAHWVAGHMADTASLLEATLADRERVLGADDPYDPDILDSRNNLGSFYWSQGRHADAIHLLEPNLADRAQVLGPHHRDTLASRSNLAFAYQSVGRFPEAITMLEANIAEMQLELGDHHRDVLRSNNNLAVAYQNVGRIGEAIELLELNLVKWEQVLGDYRMLGSDHPDVLSTRTSLAGAYQGAGRVADAIALLEANVADMERVLGVDHPDAVASRNTLNIARQSAGNAVTVGAQGDVIEMTPEITPKDP